MADIDDTTSTPLRKNHERTKPCSTSPRRRILGAVAALAVLPIAATAAGVPADAGGPDAELLRLGRLFDDARAAEQAVWDVVNHTAETDDDLAEAEALNDRTAAIVDQIEALPARTLEGLQVKARALAWCWCGIPGDDEIAGTSSERLSIHIVRDLLAMGIAAA